MVKGFSTKKIKSEKSVGETLKEARETKGFSISEIEAETKVRAKYITAIEEGNWGQFSDDIYLRGFISAYVKFLELDIDTIMKTYERESLVCQKNKKCKNRISYNQSVNESKVLITPKILTYFGLGIFVISMCSYIMFQLFKFAGNPNLDIVTPENNIVVEADSTDLSGVTDIDTAVSVNDESVPVTSDGRFQIKLKLHRGINIVKIEAVNKAKKETAKVYTIEYKPKTAFIENGLNQ